MMDSIPDNIDQKYSGVELKFHYVPQVHGQPLDVIISVSQFLRFLLEKRNTLAEKESIFNGSRQKKPKKLQVN